jgi:hypothetical protein
MRSVAGTSLRDSSHVRLGVCCFSVEIVHGDKPGTTRSITCLQADPFIEIADQVLEQADPNFVSQGDGIVTFRCENGDVTYGLREHDDLRETWLGVRSDLRRDFVEDVLEDARA